MAYNYTETLLAPGSQLLLTHPSSQLLARRNLCYMAELVLESIFSEEGMVFHGGAWSDLSTLSMTGIVPQLKQSPRKSEILPLNHCPLTTQRALGRYHGRGYHGRSAWEGFPGRGAMGSL